VPKDKATNLKSEVDGLSRRQGPTAQSVPQGFAFQQLGDNVGSAFVFANVKNRESVGMVQCRANPRFLGEGAAKGRDVNDRDWQKTSQAAP
jgi:hypothetical protein